MSDPQNVMSEDLGAPSFAFVYGLKHTPGPWRMPYDPTYKKFFDVDDLLSKLSPQADETSATGLFLEKMKKRAEKVHSILFAQIERERDKNENE